MRNQLTEKQTRIYWFITRYQSMNDGRSPTIQEIRREFGYRSDNMVLKHIARLKVQGMLISYNSDSHRSIRPTLDAKRSLIKTWSMQLMGVQPEVEEQPYVSQADAFVASTVPRSIFDDTTDVDASALEPTMIDRYEEKA